MASARRISLEPNSLYVATSALANGRFHWSVIHVDEYGRCIKHHWVAINNDSKGREAYIRRSFTYESSQSMLAFFKLSEYRPIPSANFEATCATIFPQSFDTAAQNRAHGMSCATWVLALLARSFPPEYVSRIDKTVTRHSAQYCAQFTTAYFHGKPYFAIMMDI